MKDHLAWSVADDGTERLSAVACSKAEALKRGRRLAQGWRWDRKTDEVIKILTPDGTLAATLLARARAQTAESVQAEPVQQPAYQATKRTRRVLPHGRRIQATKLTWRVLPHGRRIVEYIADQHIAGQHFVQTGQGKSWDRERLDLLDDLKPLKWYEGAHLGQTVYYVAVFDRVAIADTPDWGNALYYCASDQGRWKSVFRLEKQRAVDAGARRIVHKGDWKARVRRLVQQ